MDVVSYPDDFDYKKGGRIKRRRKVKKIILKAVPKAKPKQRAKRVVKVAPLPKQLLYQQSGKAPTIPPPQPPTIEQTIRASEDPALNIMREQGDLFRAFKRKSIKYDYNFNDLKLSKILQTLLKAYNGKASDIMSDLNKAGIHDFEAMTEGQTLQQFRDSVDEGVFEGIMGGTIESVLGELPEGWLDKVNREYEGDWGEALADMEIFTDRQFKSFFKDKIPKQTDEEKQAPEDEQRMLEDYYYRSGGIVGMQRKGIVSNYGSFVGRI